MKKHAMILVVLMFAVAACGKKKEAPPASGSNAAGSNAAGSNAAGSNAAGSAAPTPTDPTPTTPTDPTPPAVATVEVPTPEDFEEEAAKAITDKNLEQQVKAMEAELIR